MENFCFGGIALFFLLLAAPLAKSADVPPLKICLLSASAEYDSDKSLGEFQTYLEKNYRIVCSRAFGKDKGTGLPGIEALDNSDLMVVFTRRVTLPDDQLAILKKYIASGRPIIGLRTASHGFQSYPEFDKEVQGGGYKGHYTNSVADIKIVVGQKQHPVLADVTPFQSRKLYKNPTLADDVTVLLNGTTGKNHEPVAWVRQHNSGRVFYTSLGTQEDFTNANFRQLLVNAIFWTTQRDEAASRIK